MKNPSAFLNMIHRDCSDREILNRTVLTKGMSHDELRLAVTSVKVFRDLSPTSVILKIADQWVGGETNG